MLQAHREARPARDPADGEQHARHEARPVEGVGADGQLLPRVAEHDLLVGDQPAQPDGVDVRRIHIDVAAHSSMLEPILERFGAHLRTLTLAPPQPFRLDLTALALVRRPNNRIDTWRDGAYRRWVPVSEPYGPGPVPQILLEVVDGAAGGPLAGRPPPGSPTETLLVRAFGRLPEEQLAAAAERVTRRLERLWPFIGHIQIAGIPDRREPDEGEVNFPHLFETIDRLGYDGWIGCEYRPAGRTVDGLGWMTAYANKAAA